jgi:hypothetical protein
MAEIVHWAIPAAVFWGIWFLGAAALDAFDAGLDKPALIIKRRIDVQARSGRAGTRIGF